MPAYNFKRRFAEKVESGQKTQTIRKIRKTEIKNGDTLKLWRTQRSPNRRKLGDAVCTMIVPLEIHWTRLRWRSLDCRWHWISGPPYLDGFARRDGLDQWDDMRWFFKLEYEMPCRGLVLIGWGGSWDPLF